MPTPKPRSKSRPKPTAREKLSRAHASHGSVCDVPPAERKRLGGAKTLLIPKPSDVEAEMRIVRKGTLQTLTSVRQRLAHAAGAEAACPLVTGIFARLVSEASEEDRAAGKKSITPYWRTIKDAGKLNDKYPGGVEGHAKLLRQEGHAILKDRKGRPAKVAGFEG